MLKKINIKKFFALMFIITGLVPIIILTSYMFYNNKNSYMREFDNNIKNNLNILYNVITSFDEGNRKVLEMFTRHPSVKEAVLDKPKEENVIRAINDFQNNYMQIHSIALAMNNGKVYSTMGKQFPSGYNALERQWYKEAKKENGEIILLKPYESILEKNKYTIVYSKALVNTEDRSFYGVAYLSVDLDYIKNIISDMSQKSSGLTFLLSEQGDIITGKECDLLSNLKDNSKILKDISYKKSEKGEFSLNNISYIYYKKPHALTSWNICVVIPKSQLITGIFKIAAMCVLSFIVLILIVLIFSSILTNVITVPIYNLEKVLSKVSEGDYDCRIKYKSWLPYEFRKIIIAINNMIHKVRSQREDLQEQNEEISAQNQEIRALYEQAAAMNENLNELLKEQHNNYKETVLCLANAIEASDQYTKGHCERVMEYALRIGKEMNFNEKELCNIQFAGMLHDIGKIGVPINILNKNGRLTEEEYSLIKKHPTIGYKIVKDVDFLKDSAEILYEHHERIDGKGYPRGLRGEDINIFSRILTVADCYDAMTSSRPYRAKALTHEEAIRELIKNSETQFDKKVVDIFIKSYKI